MLISGLGVTCKDGLPQRMQTWLLRDRRGPLSLACAYLMTPGTAPGKLSGLSPAPPGNPRTGHWPTLCTRCIQPRPEGRGADLTQAGIRFRQKRCARPRWGVPPPSKPAHVKIRGTGRFPGHGARDSTAPPAAPDGQNRDRRSARRRSCRLLASWQSKHRPCTLSPSSAPPSAKGLMWSRWVARRTRP